MRNPEQTIGNLVDKSNTAFISYVDKEGFPVTKAMLKPRERQGIKVFWFSTNTSSNKGKFFRGALQVNLIVALSFTVIMSGLYFFLDKFGQDPDLLPLARKYYLIILCTMVPMAVFNCFQQAANGTTDTSTPMWLILGADVLNICGNYLLIFGKFGFPELGLAGAGISTLIARTL